MYVNEDLDNSPLSYFTKLSFYPPSKLLLLLSLVLIGRNKKKLSDIMRKKEIGRG